ncbi:MAG: alpha/beta fold hydrolase [Acidobacteriota bacterium]
MNHLNLKSVRCDNLTFHYTLAEPGGDSSRGNVVLIHGSLVDLRSWDRQIPFFSRRYRTVAYSRRYNFPNSNVWDGAPHSVAKETEDLAALLDRLQLAPAVLVAHSLGGYVALSLAARSPERVRALVLSEPPVLSLLLGSPGSAALYDDHLERLWQPVKTAYLRRDTEGALRATITYFQGEGRYDRFSPALRQVLRDNSLEWEALALSADPFNPIPKERIRNLDKPVLLLSGARSLPFFKAITERIRELSPRAVIESIEGAGHEMWDSHPQACRRAALRFLCEVR